MKALHPCLPNTIMQYKYKYMCMYEYIVSYPVRRTVGAAASGCHARDGHDEQDLEKKWVGGRGGSL